MKVKSLSRVRLLATPWTAAYQAPLPMGFSRQEYWSGLPLPSPPVIHTYVQRVRVPVLVMNLRHSHCLDRTGVPEEAVMAKLAGPWREVWDFLDSFDN